MESSEIVREKEHPFAKKRWIIAVTLVVLTFLSLFYGLFAGSLSFSLRDIITGIQMKVRQFIGLYGIFAYRECSLGL